MNNKPMGESELVARMISQALHANVGPDEMVARNPPPALGPSGLYVVEAVTAVPLWRIYQPAADAIIDYFERKAELAARRGGDR